MIIEHLPSYRTLQTRIMKTKELIGCAGKIASTFLAHTQDAH